MMLTINRQVWAFYISIVSLTLSVVSALCINVVWALAFFLFAVWAWSAARRWNRRESIPMPYSMRWILLLPRGPNSPAHLRKILKPRAGERMLEVGSGIGIHALAIAESIVPNGMLIVLDLQHQMLDNLKRRAHRAGITNIITTQADARHLPYPSRLFDAAYMVGTLGEIPDAGAALRELRRVMKPEGRLVVGEVVIDPDYVSVSTLKENASRAGFVFEAQTGSPFSYFATFRPICNATVQSMKYPVSKE